MKHWSPVVVLGLCAALLAAALPLPLAPAAAPQSGRTVEILAYGAPDDLVSLPTDSPPDTVYTVPAGRTFVLTDVNALTFPVVVVLRRRAQSGQLEHVALVDPDDASGSAPVMVNRSYATGIEFGPGDEVVVAPSVSLGPSSFGIEWLSLRGFLRPAR